MDEPATKPFVLVVEDDAGLRQTLSEVLRAHGFESRCARDGQDALDELAREPTPDLVVLDLVLPRFDGWNLLGELHGGAARIPVLVISALPERRARGASSFLPKPFSMEEFIREVRRICPAARRAR